MEERDVRLKIINEVFENRFDAMKSTLLMPFLDGQAFDQAELDRLRDKVLTPIVDSGNPFESMVEMAIFMGEGVVMKSFMSFIEITAKKWNEENDKSNHRHLYYDVTVTVREKELTDKEIQLQ